MRKRIALLLAVLFLTSFVMGQVPNNPGLPKKDASVSPAPTPQSSPNSNHEMTAVDLEAFLDGVVPLQLNHGDIAGATISVVKDGKLLFAKGYGYADVEKKKSVSATRHAVSARFDFKALHLDRHHAVV